MNPRKRENADEGQTPDWLDEVPDDLDEVQDALAEDDEPDADSTRDEQQPKDAPKDDSADEKAEEPEEEPAEPEVPKPPDDQRCVAALAKLGARLDMNEQGNVWRVFFYRDHGDAALNHIFGLPSLTELWVIGSKVSKTSIAEIKTEKPELVIRE